MRAEAVCRKEVHLLTSTCAVLRDDNATLEDRVTALQQEISTRRATEEALSRDLAATRASQDVLHHQVADYHSLQVQLQEEQARNAKSAAKVKDLRIELLKVASDADKSIGEERGARQVAEREAVEAKHQLDNAMRKYKEKEERIVEVSIPLLGACTLPAQALQICSPCA